MGAIPSNSWVLALARTLVQGEIVKFRILLSLLVFLAGALFISPVAARTTKWDWPTSSHVVTRGFDRPAQNWLPGHRGIDLAGVAGDSVFAAGNGEVKFAGTLAGKGVVVISHGSVRTTYEPVLARVSVGEHVTVGQVIGELQPGESHCATISSVSCLHWGLIRGEVYLNPLVLVKKQVRLLPMHADGLAQKPRVGGP